ncbi:glycosyltransferase [Pseudoxanthomonas sp.]|uniref:glycosyltransferase n=1 Tax=Pseudoxanthomonas sp. TaxID=1871049 RepID=UPI0028C4B9EB|nr:glycosyltransferase [Pseudoxanthomonas sp.]
MKPTGKLGIVHVLDSLEYGGLERVVADLAITQTAHGHAVTVFSLCDTDGFLPLLEQAGIPVVIGHKRSGADATLIRLLRSTLLDARVDVVHTHNFVPSYYAAAATRFARRRPVLVNTCHNMGGRLGNRRLRWLYQWSLAHSRRIAMVGGKVRDHLLSRKLVPAARSSVVMNGIPVDHFRRSPAIRAEIREELGIPPQAVVVGTVGRLVELKNQRLLLDAVAQLAPSHPDVVVVLAGDGPLRSELEAFARQCGIAGRVVFTGSRKDIPALLAAFDIFTLPSRTEGLSIALLEACAAGLAVIATDVGGNSEIVRDGATGYLVPSDDAVSLHAALDTLLLSPSDRRRLGDAARAWVVDHASVDVMRQNYDMLYANALDAKS